MPVLMLELQWAHVPAADRHQMQAHRMVVINKILTE